MRLIFRLISFSFAGSIFLGIIKYSTTESIIYSILFALILSVLAEIMDNLSDINKKIK